MKSYITKEIIAELAKKHNLKEEKVQKIVEYPFKVVINTIREGLFKNIRLLHLGLFRVKPSRFKYYENTTDRKPST